MVAISTRNEGVVLELDPNIVKEDVLGIETLSLILRV